MSLDTQRRNTSGAILDNVPKTDDRISVQQLQKKRSVGSSMTKNRPQNADGVLIFANNRNGRRVLIEKSNCNRF